jgi:transposase
MPRRVLIVELQDIVKRLRLGHSVKAIHRQTGRHKTVVRAIRDLAAREGWLSAACAVPSEGEIARLYEQTLGASRQAAHPLETYDEQIQEWLRKKYSFQVIHRLLNQMGVMVSESTVRRWIHHRHPQLPSPVILRATTPGEVMEVDFGYLGVYWDRQSERQRKVWFFSGRLRHSRRAYREIAFDQSQGTFFRCHIHAFEFFGGVPKSVVADNLKAAIVRASYENPLVNRGYRSLAEHYGFLISACPPFSPELKGGVENDVKYVKRNFLPLFMEGQKQRGHTPGLVEELIQELDRWNAEVCDTHVVQKVGRSPLEIFEQEEVAALRPLPPSRWDPVIYKEASVGPDWRVQFQKAFYSVPYRLIGQRVLVMGNSTTVRLYLNGEEITMHLRATRDWQYVWKAEHAPPQMEQYLAMSTQGLLTWASRLGPSVQALTQRIFSDKAVDGLRPARALMRLGQRYGKDRLEAACRRSLRYGLGDYQSVKNILVGNLDRLPEEQPAEAPQGQSLFRFQRDHGYFDDAETEARYG